LGGRARLASDEEMLEYALARVTIKRADASSLKELVGSRGVVASSAHVAASGEAIGNRPPTSHVRFTAGAAATSDSGKTEAVLGTKWLRFWNYFSLPIGGILGLLISFGLGVPGIAVMTVLISVLQFMVAYGLHLRRLWAWKANWAIIMLTWLGSAFPKLFGSSADFLVTFVILFLLMGLIWMWPNYVYWKKRKVLFS
jgi:hypothetical protein